VVSGQAEGGGLSFQPSPSPAPPPSSPRSALFPRLTGVLPQTIFRPPRGARFQAKIPPSNELGVSFEKTRPTGRLVVRSGQ
jgi:hypothetical protein